MVANIVGVVLIVTCAWGGGLLRRGSGGGVKAQGASSGATCTIRASGPRDQSAMRAEEISWATGVPVPGCISSINAQPVAGPR